MDCRTSGFPVHHQLPELAQTHVHWVGDAIQTSHPLSSPSPPAFYLSQHQGLFQWVSSLHQVAKVLEFQLSISPSNEYSGLISLGLTGLISFQSKGLSRISNTTVQTYQFFGAQSSLYIKMYIRLKKKRLSCPMQTLTRNSEIRIIFLSKTFGSALFRK